MLGSINIKARPLKMALLVDANSRQQVLAAIKLASSLWGGVYFPIVPLYKRTPRSWKRDTLKPPSAEAWVKGYLEAFDVDIIVQFSEKVPDYLKDLQLKVIKADDVWHKDSRTGEYSNSIGLGIQSLLNNIFEEHFKFKPKYPIKISVPTIPNKLAPFWSSVFGDYSDELASEIRKHYSTHLEINHPFVNVADFKSLMSPDTLFPRRLTAVNLETHGNNFSRRDQCIFFMDAENLADVVDFWNLRATGRQVIPAPKQFTNEDSIKNYVKFFAIESQHVVHGGNDWAEVATFLCSHGCEFVDMERFANSLDIPEIIVDGRASKYSLQHWYPRIWDEWARDHDGGVYDHYAKDESEVHLDSESMEVRIDPLIPIFVSDAFLVSGGVCVNELDLRIYGATEQIAQVYPESTGQHLKRAISGFTSFDEWRVGKHGLTHIVSNRWGERRRLHTSEDILFAWLADKGWKAELSTSGLLAKQLYKRLSGAPSIVANKKLLGFLEYMSGGAVAKDGTPIDGNRQDPERDVPVGEVKSRLDGKNERSMRFEDFVERGVFKLGLRAKCPTCQRSNWFSIDTLGSHLNCPKCQTSFPAMGTIDRERANWHYRTSGPFSVPNFADGAYSVLLTLEALSGSSTLGIRATSVPSFTARNENGHIIEADLAIIWREGIHGRQKTGMLFGECKSYGKFEPKDIARMKHLGESFPGAVLVFSTFRESLSSEEIKRISRLARAGRKHWKADHPKNPVLILTARELFTWQRPPYCWDSGLKQKYQHVHGLVQTALATQEIYLHMPSVHEDLEKAIAMRKAKIAKSH